MPCNKAAACLIGTRCRTPPIPAAIKAPIAPAAAAGATTAARATKIARDQFGEIADAAAAAAAAAVVAAAAPIVSPAEHGDMVAAVAGTVATAAGHR